MNYLLFTYFDNTVENAEEKTQEIGTKLAEHMTSGQVKFMFGERHAIFHFAYKGDFQDVSDVMMFINEELEGFEYLITKKSKDYSSNFDEDNLNHLMSLKNTTPKKRKPTPPRLRTKNLGNNEPFFDIADLIMNFKRPEICDMTLDELLDKIGSEGMESLSELERKKLDEYSKSL
jgi:hypothetical protein